ncbi:pyridoxamine 5'-phosphate oxidase family protein [Nonomuraea sp. M3C6]|uniref:Pyridoxamine 5'-phosphate oxidase family protein n=1 Tax=Nonomuraea marmarensis TaxID=3351344 RepID=A0ABW7AKZ3_9ACTN
MRTHSSAPMPSSPRHGVAVLRRRSPRRKVANLRREPRVSLTVFDAADPLQYVEVRGTATARISAGGSPSTATDRKTTTTDAVIDLLSDTFPDRPLRVGIRSARRAVAGRRGCRESCPRHRSAHSSPGRIRSAPSDRARSRRLGR